MKKLVFVFFVLSLSLTGCKNNPASTETAPAESTETVVNKYTLTPFSPSASFPGAKMESMDYKKGRFTYVLGGEGYQLGVQTPDADQKMCANSSEGQHIHLIVDDLPYAAKYEASFEHPVEDGRHYILSFLSRSYHESIKTRAAHLAMNVNVKDGNITGSTPIETEKMLFYSRPKGVYVGQKETEKIMLDFYLVNVELGDEYKVKAEINGEAHILDTWQPYYIEGMEMGDNTIKLTLIDKNGNAVATPLNPVERTFTLKPDPTE